MNLVTTTLIIPSCASLCWPYLYHVVARENAPQPLYLSKILHVGVQINAVALVGHLADHAGCLSQMARLQMSGNRGEKGEFFSLKPPPPKKKLRCC